MKTYAEVLINLVLSLKVSSPFTATLWELNMEGNTLPKHYTRRRKIVLTWTPSYLSALPKASLE